MKRPQVILLIVVGIILMYFANPSYDTHRETINNRFKKDHAILGPLGGGKIFNAFTTYNDYYLFSTTDVDGEVVSVGIFGKVFVRNLRF